MKKLIFTLTFAVAASQCLYAQNSSIAATDTTLKFKNYIFGEIAGSSLGLTVNYERFLSKNPGGFSVRAGLGFGILPDTYAPSFFASIPLGISYNFPVSKNKHDFFELGGSYTFISGSDDRTSHNSSLLGFNFSYSTGVDLRNIRIAGVVTGWRHTSASGKTQIRLYLMPVLVNVADHASSNVPDIGFSIGHRF